MIKCNYCKFENLNDTRYCQKCGKRLSGHTSLLGWKALQPLAGTGARGTSIAPIAALTIDEQAQELGVDKSPANVQRVNVIPLPDGSWFCPECGDHNKPYSRICSGCGRDFE